MSIRTKVLLFAVLATGLILLLGIQLFLTAQRGQRLRERLVVLQQQLASYERLEDSAWPYLNALIRARHSWQDSRAALLPMQERLSQERAVLEACLTRERQWPEYGPREGEDEEVHAILHAFHLWVLQADARVLQEPAGVSVEPVVEWALYQQFSEDVGQLLAASQQAEQEQMDMLQSEWERNARDAVVTAMAIPALCLVLVLGLSLAILVPMQRSLQVLQGAARRLGQGDFDVSLPDMGPRSELGSLASALERMARELRDTLRDKQQLLRAEAEASEREARRYSALLEDTVRTRTAELATANSRLQDSLQQLQDTQEQLLVADRLASVGRLAAGVGHEINNPLAYILSNLRYIQDELQQLEASPSPEARQELLEAISEAREGADRVRLIVRDLKTLSRPDDVSLGPVDLVTVLRSAARMAAHEIRGRARLVEELGEVPPVHGNALRLGQVFLNLLLNAAHAITPGRAEENEIRVVARPGDAGLVIVEVRDTGCGIPPENLQRIFEPFFTTKPEGVGTGLGLAVCRSILSSLGGSIHVESQPGRGTTFLITLRLAEQPSHTPQPQAA
jgi:signal transduction histidine kinase